MPEPERTSGPLSRRIVLTMAGGALLASSCFAWADESAKAEIAKILAGRTAKPGGIKLDVPSIAENGLVVPVTVEAESPMTETDHIKVIHLFAEGNPNPLVASFHFTPLSGRAAASTRMRLAQTQNVVVFAETASGEVRTASAEIKVTIGGCGG